MANEDNSGKRTAEEILEEDMPMNQHL